MSMSNDEPSPEDKPPDEIWIELRDDADRLWARLELVSWHLELRRNQRSATFDLRIWLLRRWGE